MIQLINIVCENKSLIVEYTVHKMAFSLIKQHCDRINDEMVFLGCWLKCAVKVTRHNVVNQPTRLKTLASSDVTLGAWQVHRRPSPTLSDKKDPKRVPSSLQVMSKSSPGQRPAWQPSPWAAETHRPWKTGSCHPAKCAGQKPRSTSSGERKTPPPIAPSLSRSYWTRSWVI